MPDPKTDPKTDPLASTALASTQAPPVVADPYAGMSDDGARRAREQAYFDRKASNDDAARVKAGTTRLRAVAGFVIHDDPTLENGREVRAGEEFEVSDFDLPMYLGRRGVRVSDLDQPVQGVTVQNT